MQRDKGIVRVVLLGWVVVSSANQVGAAPHERANGLPQIGAATRLTTKANLPPGQELGTEKYSYYRIPVRNAEPDFLAWQLDPAYNKEPQMVTQSRRNLEEARGGFDLNQFPAQAAEETKNPTPSAVKLPLGVDSILPLTAQHALLVTATPGGAREVQILARSLDKALAQVGIMSQVVEINRDDAKTLGVEFTDQKAAPSGGASLVKANYKELLSTLITQHKAKIVVGLNITAANKLAASIATNSYNSLRDDTPLSFSELQMRLTPAQAPVDSRFFLARQQRLTVVPTLKDDETLTLRCMPCFGFALIYESFQELTAAQGNSMVRYNGHS